ncbi:MAG: group 1 truncated hemoglobin [Flavobacteriales bacterium]|jgi:hemoglobin|nr:group 1 truncated hemoglobin [Flavobacteriales bacterium]
MVNSIYDEVGGFMAVRKLISAFYDNVLDNEELAVLFQNVNMERLIDHQTKFFAMLLGGPVSYTDEELKRVHARLGISNHQFDLTKDCLIEAMEDFDFSEDYADTIAEAFEEKRNLIVQSN